jgi:hypothetical protein
MSISHLKADKKKGLRNLSFKVKIARRRYGQKDIIKYFVYPKPYPQPPHLSAAKQSLLC